MSIFESEIVSGLRHFLQLMKDFCKRRFFFRREPRQRKPIETITNFLLCGNLGNTENIRTEMIEKVFLWGIGQEAYFSLFNLVKQSLSKKTGDKFTAILVKQIQPEETHEVKSDHHVAD